MVGFGSFDNCTHLQESSRSVEDGLTDIWRVCNKENCNNQVLSGRWNWLGGGSFGITVRMKTTKLMNMIGKGGDLIRSLQLLHSSNSSATLFISLGQPLTTVTVAC